ncbi:MAG: MarR family transcriptional regulator [Chloroflexi bacterium]|nr:MAG: MarR family transcriptional regulator [Chloroflexota bacterium]
MNTKLDPTYLEAWRSFITTHAMLINHIDKSLNAAGQIPLHWYDVLIELYEAPEQRLRMHELADAVVLSRSGLTRLVNRLEKAGLLRRELDEADRRGFYAIITDAGIDAMRSAWPVYAAGIQQYFADHLTKDEAKLLTRVFMQMMHYTKVHEADDE